MSDSGIDDGLGTGNDDGAGRAWDAVRVRHLADWGHVPGPVPAGR